MMQLTQALVKDILDYDTETGIFTWKSDSSNNGNYRAGQIAGSRKDGYVVIRIFTKPYRAHRLAWLYVHGEWPKDRIDHKNGIRNDNRILNLRPCTQGDNVRNSRRPKTNTSGYKGVSFNTEHRKWRAAITVNGRSFNLGYFLDPEVAHQAYVKASKIHFGEFARAE